MEYQSDKHKPELEANRTSKWIGTDEKNKWGEIVKCYGDGELQDYTLPWSQYIVDDLFSTSKIESVVEKKSTFYNLHSIKLLRVLY